MSEPNDQGVDDTNPTRGQQVSFGKWLRCEPEAGDVRKLVCTLALDLLKPPGAASASDCFKTAEDYYRLKAQLASGLQLPKDDDK